MEFDIVHLEVDGTMANPAVAAAVVLCSAALSGIAWVTVSWMFGSSRSSLRRQGGYALLSVAVIVTFFAQLVLAEYFYRRYLSEMGPFDSVGFWNGPPMLPALVSATVVGALAWLREKHRFRKLAASPK